MSDIQAICPDKPLFPTANCPQGSWFVQSKNVKGRGEQQQRAHAMGIAGKESFALVWCLKGICLTLLDTTQPLHRELRSSQTGFHASWSSAEHDLFIILSIL